MSRKANERLDEVANVFKAFKRVIDKYPNGVGLIWTPEHSYGMSVDLDILEKSTVVPDKKLEINPNKLEIEDTYTLSGGKVDQKVHEQDNPSRGAIKVILSNYTDQDKTFVISVKEI